MASTNCIYYNTKTAARADLNRIEHLHQSPPGFEPGLPLGRLWSAHREELHGSAIPDELADLNFASLEGRAAAESLLYALEDCRNDGRLRNGVLRKYRHVEHGGWWFGGVDPRSGERIEWGCFKPDRPRSDGDGDPIKYEAPPKAEPAVFACAVTWRISYRIACNHGKKDRFWKRVKKQAPAVGLEQASAAEAEAFWSSEDLEFWPWWRQKNLPVVLTEGAKKVAALTGAGHAAIGGPGVWNLRGQPRDALGNKLPRSAYLLPEVTAFATSKRQFTLAFDQDTKPKTVKHVNAAIFATGGLLQRAGCKVHVATWPATAGKGADDLIANEGPESFQAAIAQRRPLASYRTDQLRQLTYEPDLRLNQRYLPDFEPPSWAQLVAICSPKGTGKTEWLRRVFENSRRQGRRMLYLTHRRQLGQSACDRIGIDFAAEVYEAGGDGGATGMGACVDSLHPNSHLQFDPSAWYGADLAIDEIEQVLWHMLNSGTCAGRRAAILRTFEQLIANVLDGGGRILMADADLTDRTIDYIGRLAKCPTTPWVVTNEVEPVEGAIAWLYEEDSPAGLYTDLLSYLHRGDKVLACTSGQQASSKWGTQSLESDLRQAFPHKRILRIDAETIADPEHEAYGSARHLNELMPQYDAVIASPVLETGVSIDCACFDRVFGFMQGGLPEPSVSQFLARERQPVDRHVWAPKVGNRRFGNGSSNPGVLRFSEQKAARQHINLLGQLNLSDFDTDPGDGAHLTAWTWFAAAINGGMADYRNGLAKLLERDGYAVISTTGGELMEPEDGAPTTGGVEGVKERVSNNQQKLYQAACERIANADTPSDIELEQLNSKRAKTQAERDRERKGKLEQRYQLAGTHTPPRKGSLTEHGVHDGSDPPDPPNVSADLVKADDDGWFCQLRAHYYLTRGRDRLHQRDSSRLRRHLERAPDGKTVWPPDFAPGQMLAKIVALEKLGIPWLLEQAEVTAEDVRPISELACKASHEIKSTLGVTVSERVSPVQNVQTLLQVLGLKMPRLKQGGSQGDRQRVYGTPRELAPADLESDPIDRYALFERWAQAEATAQASGTHTPPLNKSTGSPVHSLAAEAAA